MPVSTEIGIGYLPYPWGQRWWEGRVEQNASEGRGGRVRSLFRILVGTFKIIFIFLFLFFKDSQKMIANLKGRVKELEEQLQEREVSLP